MTRTDPGRKTEQNTHLLVREVNLSDSDAVSRAYPRRWGPWNLLTTALTKIDGSVVRPLARHRPGAVQGLERSEGPDDRAVSRGWNGHRAPLEPETVADRVNGYGGSSPTGGVYGQGPAVARVDLG